MKLLQGTKTYPNTDELYTAIQAAWEEMRADPVERKKLVDSMQTRLQELVRKRGGPIGY